MLDHMTVGCIFLQVEPHHVTEKIDSYIKNVPIEAVGRSVQGFSWEGEKVRYTALTLLLVFSNKMIHTFCSFRIPSSTGFDSWIGLTNF